MLNAGKSEAGHIQAVSGQTIADVPLQIIIPALDIYAGIEAVFTSNGVLGAPLDPAHAGWFAYGPKPGEVGSAVIDGHYGWVHDKPAIFDNLSALHVGDAIFIKDKDSNIITFRVREIKTYLKDENTFDVFNSKDEKSHLNIITCQGSWNKQTRSYPDRLVVFSDRE